MKDIILATLPDRLVKHLQAADHYWRGEPEIRLLPQLCDPQRIAIDVGANIGTYTYFLRRHALAVRAYEPNPSLAKRLAKLYPDVTVRPVAVSDEETTLTLRIPDCQHELASVCSDAEGEPVEVSAIRLDDEGLTNVGFIKIDVERHELAVLQGAITTIRRCRPNLMTEATPLLYHKSIPEMFSFITDLGYTGWFRFCGRYLPFSAFQASEHAVPGAFGTANFMGANVIFRPK